MAIKKLTVRLDSDLCDKARVIAEKRGQNNIEFYTSLIKSAIRADNLLESLSEG